MTLRFKATRQNVLLALNRIHARFRLLLNFLHISFGSVSKAWSLSRALGCIIWYLSKFCLSLLVFVAFEICSFSPILSTGGYRHCMFIVSKELLRLSWLWSIDIVRKHSEIKSFTTWLIDLDRDYFIHRCNFVIACLNFGCRRSSHRGLVVWLLFLFEYAWFLPKLYSSNGAAHLGSLASVS